jgi:hypothetical protein
MNDLLAQELIDVLKSIQVQQQRQFEWLQKIEVRLKDINHALRK